MSVKKELDQNGKLGGYKGKRDALRCDKISDKKIIILKVKQQFRKANETIP